jgi:Transposase DDE domain
MRSGPPPAPRQLKPRPRDEAPNPKATANVTDPDSRFLRTRKGSVQGYNAQAVTTDNQLVVAAELTQDANDLQQLEPMLKATAATLAAAGIAERPGTLLADSGYWSIANLTEIEGAPELLIPPAKHARQGKPRKDGKPSGSKSDGLRAAMTAKLNSEDGKARYAKRKETVEAVFGQIKDVRGARRLMRRGLAACDAEWKLLCGTHNLLKLWRRTRQPAPTPLAAPEPTATATSSHAPIDSRIYPLRTTSPAPGQSAVLVAGCGNETSPFSNGLVRVNRRWPCPGAARSARRPPAPARA